MEGPSSVEGGHSDASLCDGEGAPTLPASLRPRHEYDRSPQPPRRRSRDRHRAAFSSRDVESSTSSVGERIPWLSPRNSRTGAGQNAEIALPAPVRVHGGPKTPPEARRDSGATHSIPCCVLRSIQTDRAPESLGRHVPFRAALDAERCRQSIIKVDCGPTRSG